MNKPVSLTEVAALGRIEQVDRLLAEGTDPNARVLGTLTRVDPDAVYMHSSEPVTHVTEYDLPLVAAIDNDHTSVARLLLEYNADPNLPGQVRDVVSEHTAQQIPLDMAITKDSPEMVQMLVAYGAIWQRNKIQANTPSLYYAIDKNHAWLALWLLKSGLYRKEELEYWDMTAPLSLSLTRKQPEVAKELIRIGVNVNQADYSESTALHHAALCPPPDSVELITLLVNAGANIDASDDDWETSLHRAVQFNLPENVEALLRNGANVDAMSKHFTPLHLALFMSNGNDDRTEIINILLRYNANTYIVNKGLKRPNHPYLGKDALQMAEVAGSQYGAKPFHKAYASIIRHHREQGQVD